jgi:primosomal replication protein N
MILGCQMFCVLVNSFAPSATFEPLVKAFLLVHSQQEETPVGIMAKCELPALISRRKLTAVDCSAKLDVLITQGARGKILTVGEIETASVSSYLRFGI